ncbi:MAG TPA: hypothetical protein VEO19_11950 [Terriglobia bacterium]|nr:hypothetical protein [Terriglobia bacterium]
MARNSEGFDQDVKLPPELKVAHIRKAIEYIEKESAEFVDVYFDQANVFSGLVGILGVRALHSVSPYKKHKHPDVAQQRFPDLSLAGRLKPPPESALESKGTTRPWALQSHYNHAGWYIVWRHLVDPAKIIKPGKSIVVWRVDAAFLQSKDWKYEGSKAREVKGGRTHTFGVRNPAAKFAQTIIYHRPKIVLRQSKPTLANGGDEER